MPVLLLGAILLSTRIRLQVRRLRERPRLAVGVANDEQRERVDLFIDDLVRNHRPLLPAFHPVIEPVDEDWNASR